MGQSPLMRKQRGGVKIEYLNVVVVFHRFQKDKTMSLLSIHFIVFGSLFLLLLSPLIIVCLPIYKKRNVVEEEPEEIIEEVETAKLTESYLTLDNYIGQGWVIDYIKGHIKRAQFENRPLGHILLWGNGGLGKSTLMKAVAVFMGVRFIEIIPLILRNVNDFWTILMDKKCPCCGSLNLFNLTKCRICKTNIKTFFTPEVKLKEGDLLFLEECHNLKPDIEEAMYSLIQDSYIIVRYNGEDKRVEFPKITVAGATTSLGSLQKPFRDRFGLNINLEPYSQGEIKTILDMYASHKEYFITDKALEMLASISFGIPRLGKKAINDAITRADEDGLIDEACVNNLLSLKRIDENGLTNIHRKILQFIYKRQKPTGVVPIAAYIGTDKNNYEELYEKGLIYNDLVFQGPRGRELTDKVEKLYFNCTGCDKFLSISKKGKEMCKECERGSY